MMGLSLSWSSFLPFATLLCCALVFVDGEEVVDEKAKAEAEAKAAAAAKDFCTKLKVQTSGFYGDEGDGSVYYYCHAGTKQGVKLECDPNTYLWNQDQQSCVPVEYNMATDSCTSLPTIDDSIALPLGPLPEGAHPVGKKFQLECMPGYRLVNKTQLLLFPMSPKDLTTPATIVCNRRFGRSSAWQLDFNPIGNALKCVHKCKPNPCGFGKCEIDQKTGDVECKCTTGWKQVDEGKKSSPCLTRQNNCAGKKCSDHGICINLDGDKSECKCEDGYDTKTDCADKVKCKPDGLVKDGLVGELPTEQEYNKLIRVQCETGYRLGTSEPLIVAEDIRCNEEGYWEAPGLPPVKITQSICTKVDCGQPKPENAEEGVYVALTLTGTETYKWNSFPTPILFDTKLPQNALPKCVDGYELEGTEFKCQADGKWGPAKCVPKDCGTYPNHENAIPLGDSTKFGSTMTVHCTAGFVIKSDKSKNKFESECDEKGDWTPTFPGCVVPNCNADDITKLLEIKDTKLVAVEWRTLKAGVTGRIVGTPEGAAIDAEQLPKGTLDISSEVKLSCGANSMLAGVNGDDKVICTEKGWSPPLTPSASGPRCKDIKCEKPSGGMKEGGEREFKGDGTPDTTELTINCDEGFYIKELATTAATGVFVCKKNENKAEWVGKNDATIKLRSSPVPQCARVPCTPLPIISSAKGSYAPTGDAVFGDKRTLTCVPPLVVRPFGKKEIECNADKTWSDTLTCETKKCQDITVNRLTVKDKATGATASVFEVDKSFTFVCETGYRLSVDDDYEIKCEDKDKEQEFGKYSGTFPTCDAIDHCDGKQCGNGVCVVDGATYKCNCKVGWKNEGGDPTGICNVEHNPCDDSECKNGATCERNNGYIADSNQLQYLCNCDTPSRYTGTLCQKDSQDNLDQAKLDDFCKKLTGLNPDNEIENAKRHPHPASCKKFISCIWFPGTNGLTFTSASEEPCGNADQVLDKEVLDCVIKAKASKESECTRNVG